MLYDLPVGIAGGAFYFAFLSHPISNEDDYFAVMDALRPMLDRDDFKTHTLGFYINAISLPEYNNVIMVRLNYFSNNVPETIRTVQRFVGESSSLAIMKCEHPNVDCGLH